MCFGDNPITGSDVLGNTTNSESSTNSPEICPTCPKGSEYDSYRNSKDVFAYDKGIVVNGDNKNIATITAKRVSFTEIIGRARGAAIYGFPNSLNRLTYAIATQNLYFRYGGDPYSQAGVNDRLRYKTVSRNLTLGASRGVLNEVSPIKPKAPPVRYWKADKLVTGGSVLGLAGSVYGLYRSGSNIMEAENKAKQTFIEGGGWAGAALGAEAAAPIAAYVGTAMLGSVVLAPAAPVVSLLIVAGGAGLGSMVGNTAATVVADDIFDK
jgi:hypothetical protein